MKIPVIRQLFENNTVEELNATVKVLESFCEYRGITEDELNVAGNLITDLCGAVEVHVKVNEGMKPSEALNFFAKKVMGSIDR